MSVAASPAASPTAQDRAASTLRGAILEGELRPGQRVNQEAWAERARVSLIPLREALRALAGEGLVTYRPRRGYAVTELDLGELEEVYRLRTLLETDALLRGVPRATPADVDSARGGSRRLPRRQRHAATSPGSSLPTDDSTTDSTRSPDSRPAARLIDLLWDSTEAYRALYYALPGEAAAADEAHRAIIAAVRARDPERVVMLQDEHRARALDRLRASFRGEADAPPRIARMA